MRVLHVDDQFIPALGYEAELARVQLEMGHDVAFAASRNLPSAKGLDEGNRGSSPVRAYLLRTLRIGRRNVFMPGVVRVLVRERPDVVHCHSLYDFTAVAIALLKPVLGYRALYCSHSSLVNSRYASSRVARFLYQAFGRLFAPIIRAAADRITAVGENEAVMAEMVMRVPREKLEMVRLGAPVVEVADAPPGARERVREKLGVSPGEVLVVHAGTLRPGKGLETLVEAMASPALDGLGVRCVVVGGGAADYLRSLEGRVAMSGAAERIRLIPRFVPKPELLDMYRAADIACWPGDISIATVEALAAGLPLVTLEGDAYREMLAGADNGLTTDATASGLASALATLAADGDLRDEMGRRSRELAVSEFDWRRIAERFLHLYEAA